MTGGSILVLTVLYRTEILKCVAVQKESEMYG